MVPICLSLWPVKSAPKQPVVDADGAPPILVIGTTGDPATPYEYAKSMADELSSAVLVTFNGEGHLAHGQSGCVKSLVDAYGSLSSAAGWDSVLIERTCFGLRHGSAARYSGRSCRASRRVTPAALAQMAERRTRNA